MKNFFLRILFLSLLISSSRLKAQSIIYVPENSNKEINSLASELANHLSLCTGTNFQVNTYSRLQGKGIYLSIPPLYSRNYLTNNKLQMLDQEGVSIKASENAVIIESNSLQGLQHGIYFYLEELGFRFYFPNPAWHIIPRIKKVYKKFDLVTEPVFKHRRIWYAHGTDSKIADTHYKNWTKYTKMGGTLDANFGHVYENIAKRNKEAFEKHPEYFALKENGERENITTPGFKFCYSNPGLIGVCIEDAFAQVALAKKRNREIRTISMEPSDGWNTCHCENCKKIGTPTDRVFYLANEVAKAVGKEHPNIKVGVYAYASHPEPTSIRLEKNLFTLVAMAFNTTKYSYDQLLDMWKERCELTGVYEYYGVIDWDWDMPGRPKGSKTQVIDNSIKKYYSKGMVALTAETNNGWITRGPAQYLATKLLWNPSLNADHVLTEFYTLAFGRAKNTMRELYRHWEKNFNSIPSATHIMHSQSLIAKASNEAETAEIRERIQQYKYYLHFVVLLRKFKENRTEENRLRLYSYLYRIRDSQVCASYALLKRIAPPKQALKDSTGKPVIPEWKKDTTKVTSAEINKLFIEDINSFSRFTGVKDYGESPLNFWVLKGNNAEMLDQTSFKGKHELIIKVEEKMLPLKIVSGIYRTNNKETKVYIQKLNTNDTVSVKKIKTDSTTSNVLLNGLSLGYYKLSIDDLKAGFRIHTGDSVNLNFLASAEHKITTIWFNNSFYFYVPERTEKFIVNKPLGKLKLVSPSGRTITASNKERTLLIEVKGNETGLWKISDQTGTFYLEGIPPYVSTTPNLLIPEDVE